MTPNFSGGSTLNGTSGGDRWARVLGWQIGWLSDPLRRVHAGCSETGSTNEFENANSWKAREKIRPTENTPRNPHQPHDRDQLDTPRDKKKAPRVGPYSPAYMDPGFMEIGFVQLSQSEKTTNSMSHTYTHRLIKKWHPVRTPLLVEKYICLLYTSPSPRD